MAAALRASPRRALAGGAPRGRRRTDPRRRPSRRRRTRRSRLRGRGKAVEERIGALPQLAAAQDSVDAARAASAIALDEYQATEAAVPGGAAGVRAAQAAVAQATADLGVARDQVVAFARRSYMEGSTYTGAAALITAADPGELIERAALLEAAGTHRSDVLGTVTVVQAQATAGRGRSPARLAQVTVLQEQAAAELAAAQDAEVSARAQAAGLATEQGRCRRSWPRRSRSCRPWSARRPPPPAPRRSPPPHPRRRSPSSPPSGDMTPAGDGGAVGRPEPRSTSNGLPRSALRLGRGRDPGPARAWTPTPVSSGSTAAG